MLSNLLIGKKEAGGGGGWGGGEREREQHKIRKERERCRVWRGKEKWVRSTVKNAVVG